MGIKSDLREALEVVADGVFATSGDLPDAVNPGLSIEGLGGVGLPLSQRDAIEISRISRDAPFGKGPETLVDHSVRKTWELSPAQISFLNPRWQRTVEHAVGRAVEELGVIGGVANVRCELHKCLLYEPGAHFEVHRDTEKAPGMFATLVIALPSQHVGGEVVLDQGGQRKTLSTQHSSAFGFSYLAWYADVNHAVQHVTSGHRFVLTYNLVHHERPVEECRDPAVMDDPSIKIDQAIENWKSKLENPAEDAEDESDSDDSSSPEYEEKDNEGLRAREQLVWFLDHQYSEANFHIGHLKGRDRVIAQYLQNAVQRIGFSFFLAHYEHQMKESYSSYSNEDDTWTLTKVFTPEGVMIAENLFSHRKDIIEDISYEDEDPDDEECDYTGNEDCPISQTYRRSCVFLTPPVHDSQIWMDTYQIDFATWITFLLQKISDKQSEGICKNQLWSILHLASGKHLAPEDIEALIDAASHIQAPALLGEFVSGSHYDLDSVICAEIG
ncbi:uncharacterized protein KY384_001827 [Bacidia gigantensis]|uniref:uncharacterized protein n=1 Tax=Bacidia gigantensis TaxID=2732470 RepID=UPI001D0590B6|nr:uncharacterized protein KY384_001827 [Bacidia gigantensis]KAG8533044.1 hypothetical protein KY384_001827 [Bacidia gigantensis]